MISHDGAGQRRHPAVGLRHMKDPGRQRVLIERQHALCWRRPVRTANCAGAQVFHRFKKEVHACRHVLRHVPRDSGCPSARPLWLSECKQWIVTRPDTSPARDCRPAQGGLASRTALRSERSRRPAGPGTASHASVPVGYNPSDVFQNATNAQFGGSASVLFFPRPVVFALLHYIHFAPALPLRLLIGLSSCAPPTASPRQSLRRPPRHRPRRRPCRWPQRSMAKASRPPSMRPRSRSMSPPSRHSARPSPRTKRPRRCWRI